MSTTLNRPVQSLPPTTTVPDRTPWAWVPTLYFSEGIPYVLVNVASMIMFAKMGIANAEITFWTSLLGYAWVVKPLWGPLVDLYWTKRKWVVLMQFLLAATLGCVAIALQGPSTAWWWWGSLAALGVAALFSATHDIAADGFYMTALDERKQSIFVGIRSTFYRFAMIAGQGILVIIAGLLMKNTGPTPVHVEVSAAPTGTQAVAPAPAVAPDAFLRIDPPSVALEAGKKVPLHLTLSKEPETTTVVSLDQRPSSIRSAMFKTGPEHQVKITGGERIEFGPGNWNQPQRVELEADAKLKEPVRLTIDGTAGNIRKTWSYCFGALGVLFLLLALFHSVAMPRPAGDGAAHGEEPRAPFLQAFAVVFAVVAAPILIYYYFFDWLKPVFITLGHSLGLHTQTALTITKTQSDLYNLGMNGLLLVGFGLLFQKQSARTGFLSAFKGASRLSGIPFAEVFISFFRKPGIGRMIALLLLFRLGEVLLTKMSGPFLLKPRLEGGLGLSQAEYGLAYGTFGTFALIGGGILGGIFAAKLGLKRALLPMLLIMHLPDLLFVYLAKVQPDNLALISGCVAVEQFGYGFGFAAYSLYMLFIASEGEHKTSHFAIATGFMALGVMVPGMVSGAIQEAIGYVNFYILVCFATIPSFLLLPFIPLDPQFGRRGAKA